MDKSIKVVVITVIICAFLFGGIMVAINRDRWFGDKPVVEPSETVGSTLPIDDDAGEYVPPETTQQVATGVAIPGWASITIEADKTDVVVDFPNPEANADKYYLAFELRLKDTGEVLYSSNLVKPGLHLQHITLSRALPAGEYDAIVHVQPYKMDEAQTPTNNADMETKLIVV